MKRIHLALAAAGLSLSMSAFAMFDGTYVKVPASKDGWFVGLEAMYLQPSDTNGDLTYATINNVPPGLRPIDPNVHIYSVDPDYTWGWRLFAGYKFGAANDVTIAYMRLHTKDDDEVSASIPFQVGSTGLGTSGFIFGTGQADYDIDQVDVSLGQKIDITACLHMRVFGGLRYTHLDRTIYQQFNAESGAYDTPYYDSDFKGLGPIFGTNIWYALGYGFNIVGSVDAALLVGKIDSELNVSTYNSSGVQTSETDIATEDTRRVATVIDMRLGVNYVYELCNDAAIKFEVGYQTSTYHHIVDKPTFNEFTPSFSTSTVGYNGPYFNVVYKA